MYKNKEDIILKGTRSTTLSYSSVVNGETAVYMTAQIPESGKSNCSKNIQDKELYEANKTECRKDKAAFDEILYQIEDGGTTNEVEE